MATNYALTEDLGKLVLRLVLGLSILLHGIAKISGGVGGIVGMVEKAGLPGAFGYLVYVGEILAPLLLIVGVWTRPAALVVAINMGVAIGLAHMGDLFTLAKTNVPSGPGTLFSTAKPRWSAQNWMHGSTASTMRTGERRST